MGFFQILGAASLLLASGTQAALSSTGFTVLLEDIDYFLPPKAVARIHGFEESKLSFDNAPFVPFTVVKGNVTFDAASISSAYSYDDVWQKGFLDAIYVQNSKTATGSVKMLKGTASAVLPPGPYFINAAGQVYEAWRLFSDVQGAFTESVIAKGDGSYGVLPAGIVGQKLAIAVPSRLYFEKTASKPLAGVRIGIKDIFDIKGLRTSNGNRAWYWLYPPAQNTAPPVQNLIDAGAIIVGKTITSQFANGEGATADWVDYHEAFNPRGDGYQDTLSSSSGSGAGAAAYGWLDVTLGSDTGGSVRGPAAVQGIYGNRPSHGLVSLAHTMPLSPTLDTPGLFARDPVVWRAAAQAMYRSNINVSNTYPKSIKTIDWPTSAAGDIASQLLIDFVGNLTSFLSANTTSFDLTSSFSQENANVGSITDLMSLTYAVLITKQQAKLVREPFYRDYAAKHDGRRPFVNPVPLVRWGWGDNQTIPVEQAIANKTIFMNWAAKTFLAPSASTCSDSLVLYVGRTADPNPRNVYFGEPGVPIGWSSSRISLMAEAPDFVVPIGEAPYNSTITGHIEYLPVSVNFVAAKGCDGMLFGLIEELYKKGILKESLPGRSGVTGGDILFKRGLEWE